MYEWEKKGSDIKDSQCFETDSEMKIELSGSFWKISSRRGSGSSSIKSLLSQMKARLLSEQSINL